ncbi:MAG: thioesterase [Anaerolineae bacterium]|nr:thioesterase [Anaerolineae bacterium]
MDTTFQPGLAGSASVQVTSTNTAQALGSGLVPVFATPALVALLEQAAVNALTGSLLPGSTSVGTHIDVRHMAATPVGMMVTATATLVEADGRRLCFEVAARDDAEPIAEGIHERVVVDEQRFMDRVEGKRAG